MNSYIFKILCFFLLLGSLSVQEKALSQEVEEEVDDIILSTPDKAVINNIFIVGNEKTKKNIILRELSLAEGVVYDWKELLDIIQADQKKIYNLQLFNRVEITPLLTGTEQIELLISVTERWYIIPSIIFSLADRNFAEWWTNQNRDFSRVNYGLRLSHSNVGGRNEKMRFSGQLGFTKALDILYSFPYIDKNQQQGIAAQFTYFTNKIIPIGSSNNKQVFYKNENEETLRKNISAFLKYTYRGSFYNFHFITLGYNNTWINNDVFLQNPNYFLHEGNNLGYFVAGYSFRHDRRDNNAYPTDGELINAGLTKYGLINTEEINELEFTLNASRYLKFNDKFHFATGLSINAFLSARQPYSLVRGIGYQPNFIRGYELNVIEGQQIFVQKNSFRYRILNIGIDLSDYMPLEEFAYFPIKLYASANYDHGYVRDRNLIPENARLTNQYLYGYGAGLDLVTFYDMVFRFEYSITNKSETNFFINFRAPF